MQTTIANLLTRVIEEYDRSVFQAGTELVHGSSKQESLSTLYLFAEFRNKFQTMLEDARATTLDVDLVGALTVADFPITLDGPEEGPASLHNKTSRNVKVTRHLPPGECPDDITTTSGYIPWLLYVLWNDGTEALPLRELQVKTAALMTAHNWLRPADMTLLGANRIPRWQAQMGQAKARLEKLGLVRRGGRGIVVLTKTGRRVAGTLKIHEGDIPGWFDDDAEN